MTSPEHTTLLNQPDALVAPRRPLAGVALLLFLFVGLLSSGRLIGSGQIERLPDKWRAEQILDGNVTHWIARELSKASFPTTLADLERGASWLLLRDTGPRVRRGCPDWLFLADELKVDHQAQRNADAKAQAVIELKQQLSRRGISLLVVIVPDKSRIASGQRCSLHRPASLQGRIQAWTSKLNVAGVSNLDLTGALTPLGASAWLRTDTHWNESGAPRTPPNTVRGRSEPAPSLTSASSPRRVVPATASGSWSSTRMASRLSKKSSEASDGRSGAWALNGVFHAVRAGRGRPAAPMTTGSGSGRPSS